jgi:O-antigen ligase
VNHNYTKEELIIVDIAILLGGIIACLYAFYYTISNLGFGSRLVLTAQSDPNGFVGRVLLAFYVSFKFLADTERRNKLLYYACFILLLLSVLSTGSRGAFVSIVPTLIIWMYSLRSKNWIINLLAILLVITGIIVVLKILPEDLYMRVIGIESYTRDFQSDYSRSSIWKTFFTVVFPISPVIGFGSGTAGLLMQKYLGRFKGMHNTYFTMWLEYGILGLPIFIWFILSIYKKLRNQKMFIEIGLLVGTMSIIFFLDAYAKKYLWNILSYLLISISLNKGIQPESKEL